MNTIKKCKFSLDCVHSVPKTQGSITSTMGMAGYETFQQRYDINYNHQGGAAQTSPIIFSPGKRCSLKGSGFLSFLADNAPRFKALVVFIEVSLI